ncbi:MAG: hypothetical protein Q9196_002490, partial [Gyalolechia fulgens]
RLHVVVWYCWISLSVTILAVRAFQPFTASCLQWHLIRGQWTLLGKSVTLSGLLVVLWVLGLYGIITGIWWLRLQDYFVTRGERGEVMNGNTALAAVALTGHYADVTMGMVLLPVARHSALASFFRLSPSTTFAFHMIQAYLLCALVLIHGAIYASWVPVYYQDPRLTQDIFPLLNPTYLHDEVWPGLRSSLGIWRASLVFTGLVTALIMLALLITALPIVRRKHFNVFYFTHLLSIVAVIVICLHASTMFYCTAPGLAMWLLDWSMRVYELSARIDSSLTTIGKGWFCLTLPLPRRRLDGCACHSPLAHFHIHHSQSSIREIHPFTTITHLASQKAMTPSSTSGHVVALSETDEPIMVQFLFRKSEPEPIVASSGSHPSKKKASKQWTNKVASLVDATCMDIPSRSGKYSVDPESLPLPSYQTSLRLEGPYFTPVNPASYNTVICLVAGTGISGAVAIAAAFSAQSATAMRNTTPSAQQLETSGETVRREHAYSGQVSPSTPHVWHRCVVVWSIRESDHVKLPFFQDTPGLEVLSHLTGNDRARIDLKKTIDDIRRTEPGRSTWIYLSGPNAFLEAGKKACQASHVGFFSARWS